MIQRILTFLFRPIHVAPLSLFRLLFGLVMLYQIWYYYKIDFVTQFMTGPEILFKYSWLDFLQPLSDPVLRLLLFFMLLSALFITIGLFFKPACLYLFIAFSYFSFIDKSLYNNHIYLFSMILLLLGFTNADILYSARKNIKNGMYVPYWQLFIFKFLVFVVYFYGGLAKLSKDWLSGSIVEPLLNGLQLRNWSPVAVEFLNVFVTYGGLIFDLSIGFLLLWKRTRILGVMLVIGFNIANSKVLFDDIGVFPFFMICTLVLFLTPKKVYEFLNKLFFGKKNEFGELKYGLPKSFEVRHKVIGGLLVTFIIVQLLLPFRYMLYTDNPEWTGIHSRFSWRMKMQSRSLEQFDLLVIDRTTGSETKVDYKSFLSVNQQKQIIYDPFSIVQFAKHLNVKAKKRGILDPIIKADVKVNFNGHKNQQMINPNVDLSRVDLSDLSKITQWQLPYKD